MKNRYEIYVTAHGTFRQETFTDRSLEEAITAAKALADVYKKQGSVETRAVVYDLKRANMDSPQGELVFEIGDLKEE